MTAVLSGTRRKASKLFESRFATVFRGWAIVDERKYTIDIQPAGRPEIPLPAPLVSEGWECRLLPETRTHADDLFPATAKQTLRCSRRGKRLGISYGTDVEASAKCVVGGWFTDNQAATMARKITKAAHDPRTTPLLERLDDVRRVYTRLPEPINVAFALGAMAGLRTGEILALQWQHVDLTARRIHVRESVEGPLKDDDSRVAPIQDALYPVLAEWRLKSGGEGKVVPPMRSDGSHCDDHTLRSHLHTVLVKLGFLPANDKK